MQKQYSKKIFAAKQVYKDPNEPITVKKLN